MLKSSKNKELYKEALKLSVPIMVYMGITNAVGLVDNLMIGNLGTESISAVAIAVQLILVYNLAVFGAVSGPGIYATQYYGQNNKEGFWNVFRLKFWLSVFVFIVGTIVFKFYGQELISLYLHGSDSGINAKMTLSLSYDYLQIMLWGLLPFALTQVFAGSLRETGDSVKPMVAGLISVFADILFNYLLIFGKFGFPCMGVRGAALATVISRLLESITIILWPFLAKEKNEFITKAFKTLKIHTSNLKEILIKSIPLFFNEFLWAAGIVATTQCYSLKGLDVVAGMNIAMTLHSLVIVVVIALGTSIGIIIGQQLGASKFEEAKENSLLLTEFSFYISLIFTFIVILISKYVPEFYNTTKEIKELARNFIIIHAVYLPVQALLNSLYFTLRSGGKTFITFLFDSVFTCFCVAPIAFLLCKYTELSIITILILVCCLDFIKIIIGYILIKKGVWISNLVEEKNS